MSSSGGAQQQQVNPAKLQAVLAKCPDLRKLGPPDKDVEVLETLGKGNYGYVYRGRIRSMNNVMAAIKVVYLKESELKETWQEVEILRECNHANIVRLFTTYMQGLYLWIAMENCGGGSVDTLYSIIPKPLSEEAIAVITYESVKGLAYFHQTKHIHRDIKAGNLLLTESGEVKLADFGVSARLSGTNLRANSFIGTPFWMAPEVIRSENDRNNWYDAKSDVWSIGITVIELADKCPPLADIHPFTALKLILQDAQPLGLKNPKKRSKAMNDFIAYCLTRDPKKRPSAEDLLKHPFLLKSESLRGRELLADLVEKAKQIRVKKKSGQRIDDDFDDDAAKYAVQPDAEVGHAPGSGDGDDEHAPGSVNVSAVAVNMNEEPPGDIKGKPIIEAKQSYILDEEILCSDFVGPHLLLGTDKGLLVADLTSTQEQQTFVFCIRGVRFKQLAVLEDYGVLVARCGKNDHVRQYRLSSIRKLIKMALTGDKGEEANGGAPGGAAAGAGVTPSPSTASGMGGLFGSRSAHQGVDGSSNPLEDFIKIPSTKDSTNFVIERTAGSIFMLVLIKNDMTLYEWAKDPYLRFMKVKAFWLPEQPRFLAIFHDGYFVRDLLVTYTGEANLVNVEDAKVTELAVGQDFKKHGGGEDGSPAKSDERWRTFDQLPIEANVFQTMRMTVRRQASVNRKIAAAVSPYQDGGTQVIPESKRRYLATFGLVTYIVDVRAQPVPNSPAFKWTKYPSKLLVVPGLYIIAVCENSVEICDIKTGEKLQVIQHSAALRFLCDKNGRLVIATHKKRRAFQVFILGATQVLLQQIAHRQAQQAHSNAS
ncbi:STE/STE20 protein kinase [Allomyces macrogynus ATCC 38327]|uniref:non-specific serine/threonine protein kinase n=1 Tax=Allomyces macrogynus (strain ATCC 38327) TaxID=578462 RepID=A0A0L0SZF4_ALLM3|nr:STE/STE20 protein kinase [Allomyces macrogynus ATCC 38327]|eukprot:KNE67785.1 STE/STE20 protein kinase [Allomyces macrogynus ATCC 38327]